MPRSRDDRDAGVGRLLRDLRGDLRLPEYTKGRRRCFERVGKLRPAQAPLRAPRFFRTNFRKHRAHRLDDGDPVPLLLQSNIPVTLRTEGVTQVAFGKVGFEDRSMREGGI